MIDVDDVPVSVVDQSMMPFHCFHSLLTIIGFCLCNCLQTLAFFSLMNFLSSSIFARVLISTFLMSVFVLKQISPLICASVCSDSWSASSSKCILIVCLSSSGHTCQLLIESGSKRQSINCSIVWVNRAVSVGKCQLGRLKKQHKQTNWNRAANWMQLAWILTDADGALNCMPFYDHHDDAIYLSEDDQLFSHIIPRWKLSSPPLVFPH